MIFQDANLLPWRNLLKNIALPFELKRRRPDYERISHLLERVNLNGFENKYPARAFRRHATARLDRAQPRGRPVGPADGRAVRRARRLHPRRDEPADPGNLAGDPEDHRLRHAFDRGSDLSRRSRRGHVGAAWPGRRGLSTSTSRARAQWRFKREPDFIARVLEIKASIDHGRKQAAGLVVA